MIVSGQIPSQPEPLYAVVTCICLPETERWQGNCLGPGSNYAERCCQSWGTSVSADKGNICFISSIRGWVTTKTAAWFQIMQWDIVATQALARKDQYQHLTETRSDGFKKLPPSTLVVTNLTAPTCWKES